MNDALDALVAGRDLSQEKAGDLLRALTDPAAPDALKGAVLIALRLKGETADEVRGMALAMREMALPVVRSGVIVDTCGTGGDGSDSVNVSTAAALVLAAFGVPVAKHGNRSVSSRSGSADVLEALGVPVPQDPTAALAQLHAHGFAFLFAPRFHPAMASVAPVRRALKQRTVFNLLGPICNPARPTHQLVGAFSPDAARLIAEALAGVPGTVATVVHGEGGWDEATPIGPFMRWRVRDGAVTADTVDPHDAYGVPRCHATDLAGGSAADNAAILTRVFAGERGPVRDAVLLNAALVIELLGYAQGHAAVVAAGAAIDTGRVTNLLQRLRGVM